MKFAGIAGIIVLIFLLQINVNAQEMRSEETTFDHGKGLYFGGQASTNGLGLNIRYIFNKRITLKTGFERLNLNSNFNFNENDISYDASLNYKTGSVFLIADYFYTSSLYLAIGAATSSFNPKFNGLAVSNLQYGDISIPSSKVGDFIFTLEPSLSISPFIGTGVRDFLGESKRVFYNFEIGLYYLGAPHINIEASGLLAPTADPAHGQEKYLEKQLESYKIYPVLKFNIAIKLF